MSGLDGLSREELLAGLAERDAVIAGLLAEIERLKRRVGMDSSNSSMPPGSDGPAARAKRAKRGRKPSPRRRGGQAGHEGHGLQRVACPHAVHVVAPHGCERCGRNLAGVPGRVASRVQQFDTPPVRLHVTEYQMVAVTCPGCAAVTRAPGPAGMAGPCCYGPNVRAATALLACNGHMSVERAADLMGVLLDAPVSTGFTGGLVAGVAGRLAGFEAQLKAALRAAPVLHHDETPARVAADDQDRLLYVYTARAASWSGSAPPTTAAMTPSRGSPSCPAIGAPWSAMTMRPMPSTTRTLTAVQLCCAHLLRALRGIGELDTDPFREQRCWTEPAAGALTEAKAAVGKAKADGATALDPQLLAGLRARYDTAVAWGILTNQHRDWPSGRHPGYTLAKRLHAKAAQVWRFAGGTTVDGVKLPVWPMLLASPARY